MKDWFQSLLFQNQLVPLRSGPIKAGQLVLRLPRAAWHPVSAELAVSQARRQGCTHSLVSDWLRGIPPTRLVTPGCRIGYVEYALLGLSHPGVIA